MSKKAQPQNPPTGFDLAEMIRRQQDMIEKLTRIVAELAKSSTLPPLPSVAKKRSLVNEMPHQPDAASTRRGRPLTTTHAFPLAVEKFGTDKTGRTIQEWADKHKVDVKKVRSWFSTRPTGKRTIPREWAEKIAVEFDLPATDATWPNGIRET